ncbi:release factor glutamine methyltransferase [Alphaproteobacteria bacterium]|nr:release factor glutamine methyltransferase [Alphaproteobacteria bacterium]
MRVKPLAQIHAELAARLGSRLESRLLIAHATGLDPTLRGAQSADEALVEALAARRLAHEPVAKIVGHKGFWKHDFFTTRDTLDPRADSETLVEAALSMAPREKPLHIMDLGTGTGCLLLSLLAELPRATGTAVDISQAALSVAKANAEALGLAGRVRFACADMTRPLPPDLPKADLFVANPPYIPTSEINGLDPDVRLYDPISALDGGPDGLDFYRALSTIILPRANRNACIFLEIGHNQSQEAAGAFQGNGWQLVGVRHDLSNKARCLIFRINNTEANAL